MDQQTHHITNSHPGEVSDDDLLEVIADFLALGHVENIVAMFRQDQRLFAWAGRLLTDNRLSVRLGVSVLFEHLAEICPEKTSLAIPSLERQLVHPTDWVRGEAASVLAIIGNDEALSLIHPLVNDPSPQVREVARDILGISPHG
ncbi:HEAT repeat domain-containing protein [Desulfobulbus alkaliphilus]|uniref:HEAT repeat domain-containing protein n=1 Tax=Desulfobulbus alkaliphilus TaxID=869814 RepID=UPI001964CCF9|nr:HEAT repeat domain-containing protein [Desulfobulbus alkaliphilus]MBM9537840.1 HEAT repeat domain-containing protein [Desulfobulbus alkaliphilus]